MFRNCRRQSPEQTSPPLFWRLGLLCMFSRDPANWTTDFTKYVQVLWKYRSSTVWVFLCRQIDIQIHTERENNSCTYLSLSKTKHKKLTFHLSLLSFPEINYLSVCLWEVGHIELELRAQGALFNSFVHLAIYFNLLWKYHNPVELKCRKT